ncbi:MAG TPA: hypothetical protein VGJ45_00965 [Pseudonocardiaceae bacterium]
MTEATVTGQVNGATVKGRVIGATVDGRVNRATVQRIAARRRSGWWR